MATKPEPDGPSVDTIAAVATAPGVGALALVRVSGPGALDVLRGVAPDLDGAPPPRRATLVTVRDRAHGEALDRVLATFFPGPDSYTGEDVVELCGHGGWLGPALVLDACLDAGARSAEPGEFTRRAYLNGKVDLVQAEAVVDVVEGRSRALRRAALHQLERGLSARIAELREGLVELEALLVHHIDFPEEDDAPVSRERIVDRAGAVAARLGSFLETAPEGELLREGALTVLAGRPNTGKSSLFNALLGQERAIVTDRPGTTRDAIEASASLGGYPFRLVDTAGLRATEEPVERLGVEVSRRYLDAADVVLFCAEAGRALGPDEEEFLKETEAPVVRVRTKADRQDEGVGPSVGIGAGRASDRGNGWDGGDGGNDAVGAREPAVHDGSDTEADGSDTEVEVSVITGDGLASLRRVLPALVYRGLVRAGGDAPVLTRERQRRAVARAHEEVEAFRRALARGVPAEVAATHLRPAETALEELLGVIGGDEVLDRVFGEFCIGK